MITYTNKQNLGNRLYNWNAWLGCYQKSEACQNCFIYSLNEFIDVFHLFPREFSELPSGTLIHVTLYSDFFLAEADKYRTAAWNYIKNHPNLIKEWDYSKNSILPTDVTFGSAKKRTWSRKILGLRKKHNFTIWNKFRKP